MFRPKKFAKIPKSFYERKLWNKLSPSSVMVYCLMCYFSTVYADKDGWFWKRTTDFTEYLNMTPRNFYRIKKELIDNKLIEVRRGKAKGKKRLPDNYKVICI